MKQHQRHRGTALILTMVVVFIAAMLAYAALSLVENRHKSLQRVPVQTQARLLAEAGVERARHWLNGAFARSPGQPFEGVDRLIPPAPEGDSAAAPPWELTSGESLARNGRRFGSFSVELVASGSGDWRDYVVTATGYVPNAKRPIARCTVQSVLHAEIGPAQVFDNAYSINNWGWFYGNRIQTYGNVHSNGPFDCGDRSPLITGAPRYEGIFGTDLSGYIDDNGDGLLDGNDGGIFSGWDVEGAAHVRGNGGRESNQHSDQAALRMPPISDLSAYEKQALAHGSSIQLRKANGRLVTLCDAVQGDEVGELSNLVLIGTESEPIVIDGPVVVRGDVILKGVVTGQGSIYSTGNLYLPDNLRYLNPPDDPPSDNGEASTEAWLAANQGRDFLALLAAENLVMGDFTQAGWAEHVGRWLDHPANESVEDAGADGIHHTRAGRDGIDGTEDDDLLEGDGQWSVEYYSDLDQELGLIPAGFQVGDVIPGSGEDIDGDGRFDARISMQDLVIEGPLDPLHWAGNLPPVNKYSDLASMSILEIDGVLYTQHAACLATKGQGDLRFSGSLVSRNESIAFASASLQFVHDRRLLAGAMGSLLPSVLRPLEIRAYRIVEAWDAFAAKAEP